MKQRTALVLHGLNLHPRRMDFLANELKKRDFVTYQIDLPGHGETETLAEFSQVTSQAWIDEVAQALTSLQPDVVLGYSLGGLCGCAAVAELLEKQNQDHSSGGAWKPPRGLVLLAPALGLRWYAPLMKIMAPFPHIVVPSASPRGYRRHRGTPISTYRALFDLRQSFEDSLGQRGPCSLPTLLVLNRRDELVDPAKTQNLVAAFAGTSMEVCWVSARESRLKPPYAHLMLDEDCLGPTECAMLLSRINDFLNRSLD